MGKRMSNLFRAAALWFKAGPARRLPLLLGGLAASMAIGVGAASAQATLPAIRVDAGTLSGPATSLSNHTDSNVSPTAKTTRDPLVQEMARSLNYDVNRIYEHVRDHVETTPVFGLQKGARGVILDGAGTTFDQAQFMVDMLRESDAVAGTHYAPSYIFGQYFMTAAKFQDWFGVSDPAVETRVLADGGFPAVVNASNGAVNIAHVWVKATVGGHDYYFDPSYKGHTVAPTLDLPAGMTGGGVTYSTSDLVGQAGATLSGATVSGFNRQNFTNRLDVYRDNLEKSLIAGSRGAKIEDVANGRKIVPHVAADLTQGAPSSIDRTWAGEIPVSYRTSLTVNMTGWSATKTLYADEWYGKQIALKYPSTDFNASLGAAVGKPSNDNNLAGAPSGVCDQYATPTTPTQFITIDVTHPYGGYLNRTLVKPLAARVCSGGTVYLTQDWGVTGYRSVEMMRRAVTALNYDPGFASNLTTAPTLKNVAAQYSNFLTLAGQAEKGIIQLHDLIGVHHINASGMDRHLTGVSFDESSAQQFLTMDFEGAVSVNPADAINASRRNALAQVAVAGLAFAESGVVRQEMDAPRDMTSVTLLTAQNEQAETAGSYPYYLADSSNWSTIQTNLVGYSTDAKNSIGAYINTGGYSVLVPQQGRLRQPTWAHNLGGGVTATFILTEDATIGTPEVFRSSFLAFKPSAGSVGAPGGGGYLIFDPRRGRPMKGGVSVGVAQGTDPLKKPDTPKPVSKDDVVSALTVNGRTGALIYSPPPDISDGPGEFPSRITFQRRYDSTDQVDHNYGVGWKTNWDHNVYLTNDGQTALGGNGALGAASALVAIHALTDLYTATPDARSVLAAANVDRWLADQTIDNVARVESGLDADSLFQRRKDGSFIAADGGTAKLVQSGTPTDSAANRRIYHGVTFAYTGRDGDQKAYQRSDSGFTDGDLDEPASAALVSGKNFYMTTWTLPDGHVINANMSNGTGAKLTVTSEPGQGSLYNYCSNGELKTMLPSPRSITITNSAGQSVNFGGEPIQAAHAQGIVIDCDPGENTSLIVQDLPSKVTSFTDAEGSKWSYDYTALTNSYGTVSPPSTATTVYGLWRVFRPSSASSITFNTLNGDILSVTAGVKPAATIAYGLDGTVRTVLNARDKTFSYFNSPFHSARQDPLNNLVQTYFDDYGRDVASVDGRGKITTRDYDSRDRLVLTTNPEGDSVEQVYDVRSNVTQQIKHPKSGTGTIKTIWTYEEGPTVVDCVTIKTCNKPATMKDPRLNVTNYDWDTSTGFIAQIKPPADANGVRPQTDFTYDFPASGVPFKTLKDKTQKITSSANLVTHHTYYDNTKKYALKDVTVDYSTASGHENLKTTFDYNAVGDLVQIDGPRLSTDVLDILNYEWDDDRRMVKQIDADPDGSSLPLLRPASRYNYDIDGLLTSIDQGKVNGATFTALRTSQIRYDLTGNKIEEDSALLSDGKPASVTQYGYDDAGRRSCTAVRMNRAQFTSFPLSLNPCNLGPVGGDGQDRITKLTYDPDGRVLTEVRAAGVTGRANGGNQITYATYTYRPNGQVETVTGIASDPSNRSNTSKYVYDTYDRLSQLQFPNPNTGAVNSSDYEEYGYDDNGNRVSLRKRDNRSIISTYDNLNRLIKKDPPGTSLDADYSYDLLNNPLTATFTATGAGVVYAYDTAARLTDETTNGRHMAFVLDKAGNRTRVTWPSGAGYVTYLYDAMNRPTSICDNVADTACKTATTIANGLLAKYSYDDLAQRDLLSYGNGATVDYHTYDGVGRLTDLRHHFPATASRDVSYVFAYNAAGQVTSRAVTADSGDDLSFVPHYPVTATVYDRLNRNKSVADMEDSGGAPIGFDGNQNQLISADGARTFTYDVYNRLTKAIGTTTIKPNYDPLDRLQQTVIGTNFTDFLYEENRLVAEYDQTGQLQRRYVHGAGTDEPLVTYQWNGSSFDRKWLHADEQGSIIAESSGPSGAVTQFYAYGPYGEPDNWSGSRFRYTGQIMIPEAQVYHYKARAYDAQTGRFLQTDPVGYADGLNWYAYVAGDPMNHVDPTGESWWNDAKRRWKKYWQEVGERNEAQGIRDEELHQTEWPDPFTALTMTLAPEVHYPAKGLGFLIDAFKGGEAAAPLADAVFAQETFREGFSKGGTFAGQTVTSVANALKAGKMAISDVPIQYIVRDGKTFILNTRSAQALERAGIPRGSWKAVNMTGDAAAEARLNGQLQRNGPNGYQTVRPEN